TGSMPTRYSWALSSLGIPTIMPTISDSFGARPGFGDGRSWDETKGRGFGGGHVLELVLELLDGEACRAGELFEHLRIVEVVATQAQHVASRDLEVLGVDVDHANAGTTRVGVEHVLEAPWHELALLDGDHGSRAALED